MKKKIIRALFLTLCVVPSLAVGVTSNEKTTETNLKEETYLCAGITNNLAKELHKASLKIEENKPFEEYEMYTSACVNVREEGDLDSPTITTLDPNTLVKIVSETEKWSQVQLDEEIYGYIKKDYLSADKTPISKLNRWGIELTDDEIDLLAMIVWLESGNQKMTGKEAVVETVFNRMISETFGGDLYSVLSAKSQYTTWGNRYSANPTEDEYQAIHNVLNGKTYILDYEYVYFSTRKSNGRDFIRIGDHWFAKGKIYE